MTKTNHHQNDALNTMTLLRLTLFMIVLVLPGLANAALPPAAAAKKLYADVLEAEKQRDTAPVVVKIEIKQLVKHQNLKNSLQGLLDECPKVTFWEVKGVVTQTLKGTLSEGQETSIFYNAIEMNCPGPQTFRPINLNAGATVEAYLNCDSAESCKVAAGHYFSFISSEEFEKIKTQQMQNVQKFSSSLNE